jgi:hypothetical protein
MVNFDIKIGFKEIIGLAVSIPLAYERIRKVKLKFDEKERKIRKDAYKENEDYIFGDVILSADGSVWRKEK